MSYPKLHIVDNPKLKDLLQQKTDLVIEGREISYEIDEIDKKNEEIDKQIQALEAKVDMKAFTDEADKLKEQMQEIMDKSNELQQRIFAHLKANVDPSLGHKYEENVKEKEGLENKRNKVGLKINKLKDRIVPLVQKVAKTLLEDEYEDLGDVRIENGEVVVEVFSHLDEFKKARAKRLKEKYL